MEEILRLTVANFASTFVPHCLQLEIPVPSHRFRLPPELLTNTCLANPQFSFATKFHAKHPNYHRQPVLQWQKHPIQTIQDRSRESCGFPEPRMQMPELV
ncbi:MAG: hypothetical protein ACKO2L_06250 [Planctomycetaceae bacterium]